MADNFSTSGNEAPAGNAYTVITNDSTDQTIATRAFYVGGAGDVKVTTSGGNTVTFVGVTVGTVLPVRVVRFWSTGTTATNLIGLY